MKGWVFGCKSESAYIARARVGAPMAHARDEVAVRAGERVPLAVRADEAEGVVGGALRTRRWKGTR